MELKLEGLDKKKNCLSELREKNEYGCMYIYIPAHFQQ